MSDEQYEYRIVGVDGRQRGVWSSINRENLASYPLQALDKYEPAYAPHRVQRRVIGPWEDFQSEEPA